MLTRLQRQAARKSGSSSSRKKKNKKKKKTQRRLHMGSTNLRGHAGKYVVLYNADPGATWTKSDWHAFLAQKPSTCDLLGEQASESPVEATAREDPVRDIAAPEQEKVGDKRKRRPSTRSALAIKPPTLKEATEAEAKPSEDAAAPEPSKDPPALEPKAKPEGKAALNVEPSEDLPAPKPKAKAKGKAAPKATVAIRGSTSPKAQG